jgi:hypothetical protein
MAKTKKAKKQSGLNTDLDDSTRQLSSSDVTPMSDDYVPSDEEMKNGGEENVSSYMMGEFEVEGLKTNQDEELEKTLTKGNVQALEEDDEEVIVNDETNMFDSDDFLDKEDFDPDNPDEYYQDDNY